MNRVRSTLGFTLFETLIAVMILAIAFPILFQLFSGTLRAVKKSRDYTQATAFAQHKLEELTIMKSPPMELESGKGPEGIFWERIVVPADPIPELPPIDEDSGGEAPITPPASLYKATVSVRWDADPSAPSTSFHTLAAFAPTSSAEIDPDDPDLEESSDNALP
tara:strand:+ start:647 stop:1138 length:492 start_codon:yes stop_codon:yes gene_type:complete